MTKYLRFLGATFLLSLLFILTSVEDSALADTDGPGPPNKGDFSGFENNAWGPCNDPATWTQTAGIGNGFCGRCGNKTFARSTGTCQGEDTGQDCDCTDLTSPSTCTYTFVSTPVGALEFAACAVSTLVLLAADGAVFIACGTSCGVVGPLCLACLAAAGAGGLAVICFYDECVEDCEYMGFAFAGSVPVCQQ